MAKAEVRQEQKNGNFIQFYRNNIRTIAQLAKNNSTAFDIFMFICEHMDGYNALMASYQVFMDLTGKSSSTVTRSIKYLYDNGYIDILKSGTSNVYIINQEIAWTSYGNQKQYCQFAGKILVSASENKEYMFRHKSVRNVENIEKKAK